MLGMVKGLVKGCSESQCQSQMCLTALKPANITTFLWHLIKNRNWNVGSVDNNDMLLSFFLCWHNTSRWCEPFFRYFQMPEDSKVSLYCVSLHFFCCQREVNTEVRLCFWIIFILFYACFCFSTSSPPLQFSQLVVGFFWCVCVIF